MSQKVEVLFHGPMMFQFQKKGCCVGIVNGFSSSHVPGFAVYKRNGTGGEWQLIHGPYGPETLRGDTDIAVSKAAPLKVTAKYTGEDEPNWKKLDADDFRWVLDFERDIYGQKLRVNKKGYYGRLWLNDGIFYTHARSARAMRIVYPKNPGRPVHQRKLAAIIRTDITLDQADDTVTLQVKQINPIILPYQPGVDYRIAVKNYEPPGANLHRNHLGLLSSVLVLPKQRVCRFHTADENVRMESGFDWIYPNNAPPNICGGGIQSISFPIQ